MNTKATGNPILQDALSFPESDT